ncbi:MAG: glycosyltransferase 87 family protein [Propionibacteriaceae bacterium]|jgi:hypothetical protein|nr:glycosyltransferase 87 family protein [Propionibacteriaceae bacterium]
MPRIDRRTVLSFFHLDNPRQAIIWWVATRGALFLVWFMLGFFTQGDVQYYYQKIHALMEGTPAAETLVEYPTPVIWFLLVPYLLSGGQYQTVFVAVFAGLLLLLDAALTAVLWRSASAQGTDPSAATLFWILFVPCMGQLVYMRLDLLSAAFSMLALLALAHRKQAPAGSLIALGASFKLWPAMLWPATMTDRRSGIRATIGFVVAGVVLAGVSWIYAGWDRLVSPLTWQSDRGLQIESVYATLPMVLRLFDSSGYEVGLSQYQAFEIDGATTPAMLTVASAAVVIGGALIIGLYLAWLFVQKANRTLVQAGVIMIIVTLVMIATNKTFSPQYMMWLGGPVAALLTLRGSTVRGLPSSAATASVNSSTASDGEGSSSPAEGSDSELKPVAEPPHRPHRLARIIAFWVLGITIVTQLIYPTLYPFLVAYDFGENPWAGVITWFATGLLVVRNIALIVFLVWLVWYVVRSILRSRKNDDRNHEIFKENTL